MFLFTRERLETLRYKDLLKLAKEHNVYRRYASKAELIEKLSTVREEKVALIEDVSAPSDMEDGDLDFTDLDSASHKFAVMKVAATPDKPPQSTRRSLAGPARNPARSSSNGVFHHEKSPLLNQEKIIDGEISDDDFNSFRSIRRSAQRRTLDLQNSGPSKQSPCQDHESSPVLKRQGTFDVAGPSKQIISQEHVSSPLLKRQGTFDIAEANCESQSEGQITSNESPRKLRRQGTFNIESRKEVSVLPQNVSKVAKPNFNTRTSIGIRTSRGTPQTVSASKTPFKNGIAVSAKTPSSKIPMKSKVPSAIRDIKTKTAKVSLLKESGGKKITLRSRKAPDFEAIHSKLFGKMESLVDSRQKVINKANSVQKNVPKCATLTSNQTSKKAPVARRLISPKYGASRIPAPKPIIKPVSTFTPSSLASANKKHSVSRTSTEVSRKSSRLASPFTFEAKASSNLREKAPGASFNHFGFKPAASNRRDILREVINRKGPLNKISPVQKSRQMLQTVRLNKRFELQMKHRLNQK